MSCILPDYPRHLGRAATLNFVSGRLIACGDDSCDFYQDSSWVHLQDTLSYRGGHHSSLSLSDAVLLIGGITDDGYDTELIPADGSSPVPGPFQSVNGWGHCSIKISEDTFIMTGGDDTERGVTKCTMNGECEILPVLQQGRTDHACGIRIADLTGRVINRSPFFCPASLDGFPAYPVKSNISISFSIS